MRTITREIRRAESLIKVGKVDDERVQLFERFRGFVSEGSYYPYTQHKILFENIFEDDLVLATKLCISESSVRKLRSNLSQALYDKMGYDIVDKILFGDSLDMRSVQESLDLAEMEVTVSDLVPWELVRFIDSQADVESEKTYEVGDFELELAFLRRHLLKAIKTEALECDLDKLRFLLSRLRGGSFSSQVDKYILKNLLFKKN